MASTVFDQMVKRMAATQMARASMLTAPRVTSPVAGNVPPVMSAHELAMSVMQQNVPQYNIEAPSTNHDRMFAGLNLTRLKEGGSTLLDLLSRPAAGTGEMFKYLYDGQKRSGLDALAHTFSAGTAEAFGKGLIHGQDSGQTTYVSDVLKNSGELNKLNGVGKFAAGLATDVATDPTSYIDPASIIKGLRGVKGAEDLTQATKAEKPLEGIVLPRGLPELEAPAQKLALGMNEGPKGLSKDLEVYSKPTYATGKAGTTTPVANSMDWLLKSTPPRFAAGEAGVIKDAVNPVQLSDELAASHIAGAVGKMPVLAHPGLDVAPIYKTISRTVEEDAPAAKEIVTAAAKSASVADPKLGKLRAVKMTLLQTPDYKVGGKFTVESMLKAAAADPKRAHIVERMINDEVKDIVRTGRFKDLPSAKLLGKEGEAAPFGLTLEQATHLMTHGKVGPALQAYSKKNAEFAAQFPIHDPTDLQNVFLKNARGETVSLHQYLGNLGIKVSGEVPGRVKTAVPKKITKTVTETKRITPAESLDWMMKHQSQLSKQELNYLRAARSPESFAARLDELKTKQITGNFKTLHDLIEGIKAGLIPEDSLQELYKLAGVKSADGLLKKSTAILRKTGETKKAPAKAAEAKGPIMSREEADMETAMAEEAGRVSRSRKPLKDDPWATVPAPSELIDRAAAGDISAVARPMPEISKTAVEDAAKAIPVSIIKNLVNPQNLAKYPFLSGRVAAKRTSANLRQGVGRNLHGWNKFSQYDMFKEIVKSVSARYRLNNMPKAGSRYDKNYAKLRGDVLYTETMQAMRLAEEALRNNGAKFIAGTGNDGILMSMVDSIDSLPIDTVKKFLFGKTRIVETTSIMDAAEAMATAVLRDGDMHLAEEAAYSMVRYDRNMKNTPNADALARELIDTMKKSMPELITRINKNYAEHSIKAGESVRSMSDEVVHNFISTFTDPSKSVGDALFALVNRDSLARDLGKKLGAPGDAASIAKGVIDGDLAAAGVTPGDLAEAANARAFVAAMDKEAATRAKVGAKQQASRRAEGLFLGDAAELDVADVSEIGLHAGIFRANVPVLDKLYAIKDALGRAFVPHYGNADFHQLVWAERNTTTAFARTHRALMSNAVQIAHSVAGGEAKQFIQESFKLLQQGAAPTSPGMQQVMDAIKHSTDILFGGGNASFAARNGFMPAHVNKWADFYGVPKSMRYEETSTIAEQGNIWRSWANVDDPLDALDKLHAAFQKSTVDATVGRDFSQFGSRVAKANHFRITDSSGTSTLANFIDKELYYPKEIIQQVPYLDRILDSRIWMPNAPMGKALMRMYDSVLHAWKSGVTVYRPGHHVSNLMGDMTLSFMAGVTDPLVYQKSIRVLSGRAKMYGDWDGLKALMSDTIKPGVREGKTISAGRFKLSDDEVWRAAYKQGLLPDFRVLEDIGFNESQKFGKLGGVSITKPFGGKVQHAAGGISQARDHMVRMAHFIDALGKTKASSLEEAIKEAGGVVRKWHPDGTDLTPFERSFMKRIIPFYAWMRKSTPLLVEATLMKPGRAMVLPKAMYNLATVNGIDPDSLSDPFPQDSLYPSYIADDILGPQWSYLGHQMGMTLPGDPGTGTLTELNNPMDTLINGITPAIKTPIELKSGNYLSGAKISDTSQYIDSQIPGVGPLSNMLNTSITGMEPQTDVQKGYTKPGLDPVAIANYLTGLGIRDYSDPKYAKSAISELKNKARGN